MEEVMPLSRECLSAVGVFTFGSCCDKDEWADDRVWDMERVYGSWSSPAVESLVALETGLLPPAILDWRLLRDGLSGSGCEWLLSELCECGSES